MKFPDQVVALPREVRPDEDRSWCAHSDDHFYEVEILVRPLACNGVPPWVDFEFAGRGALVEEEVARGIRKPLAAQGLEVLALVLHPLERTEYDSRVAAHA